MSSKKIFTTVGIDPEVLERLKKKASVDHVSLSWLAGKILREYSERLGELGVKQDAN